jgi:hypothetical protein
MLDIQKTRLDLNRLISEAADRDVQDWCSFALVGRKAGRIAPDSDLAEQLEGMAKAFGIAPAALAAQDATHQELLSVCRMCGEKAACRSVAATRPVSVMEDCGFCPNWISLLDMAPVAA